MRPWARGLPAHIHRCLFPKKACHGQIGNTSHGRTLHIGTRCPPEGLSLFVYCPPTLLCSYALCVAFVPGNRYLAIGTKAGTLELWDVAAGALVETIKAHEGPVGQTGPGRRAEGCAGCKERRRGTEWSSEAADERAIEGTGIRTNAAGGE